MCLVKTLLKLKAMKSIIYIFLFCFWFSLDLSAQKYSTMVMEDWVDGNWKATSKFTNAFDSKGNIIKATIELWDELFGIWDKTVTTHTLNSNSMIDYSITQMWNNDENNWVNSQKTIYTYDESNRILTEKMQMWMDTEWMDVSISTNTYNANGMLVNKLSKNGFFGEMSNFMQIIYSFNSDGTENQTIMQMWNTESGTWKNQMRSTNTYNSSKNIVSVLTENDEAGEWVNNMNSILSYNPDGSVKEALGQDWVEGSWLDSWKEFQTYNSNGSVKEKLIMDWLPEQSKWENGARWTYTYDTSSIIQPELATTDFISVFPNPFADIIEIKRNSLAETNIRLYSSSGQLVRIFTPDESHSSINLGSLAKGVYLLQISTNKSQNLVKLLKYK
jgi:hypothetical protein